MERPKKQRTKPRKGTPIDIPVPKRSEFDKLLQKAEKTRQKPEK